jgi:Anaphase-promoting complex, subunit 10 (APC10)
MDTNDDVIDSISQRRIQRQIESSPMEMPLFSTFEGMRGMAAHRNIEDDEILMDQEVALEDDEELLDDDYVEEEVEDDEDAEEEEEIDDEELGYHNNADNQEYYYGQQGLSASGDGSNDLYDLPGTTTPVDATITGSSSEIDNAEFNGGGRSGDDIDMLPSSLMAGGSFDASASTTAMASASGMSVSSSTTVPRSRRRGGDRLVDDRAGGSNLVSARVATPTITTAAVDTPGTAASGSAGETPATVVTAAPTSTAPQAESKMIRAFETLDVLCRCPQLREVAGSNATSEALSWQLSSAKPGNGVEQIRDPSYETYWQSDGVSQPHWIQVHFQRRIAISHVCLYLDYHLDESYTPKTAAIEVGMTAQDLIPATSPIHKIEFHEPSGWCIIPLCAPPDPLDNSEFYEDDEYHNMDTNHDDDDSDDDDDDNNEDEDDINSKTEDEKLLKLDKHMSKPLLKAHLIRISILWMHQNGRDTHVRRLAIFARQQYPTRRTIIQPPLQSIFNTDINRSTTSNPLSTSTIRKGFLQHDDWTQEETDMEIANENFDDPTNIQGRESQNSQATSWFIESWNHHRNTTSSDFSTLGRNSFSTIR